MAICVGCNKEFKPHINHPHQKYCSRLCHHRNYYGTDEQKLDIGCMGENLK